MKTGGSEGSTNAFEVLLRYCLLSRQFIISLSSFTFRCSIYIVHALLRSSNLPERLDSCNRVLLASLHTLSSSIFHPAKVTRILRSCLDRSGQSILGQVSHKYTISNCRMIWTKCKFHLSWSFSLFQRHVKAKEGKNCQRCTKWIPKDVIMWWRQRSCRIRTTAGRGDVGKNLKWL